MKLPYLKSMLVAGASFFAWNCTEDVTIPNAGTESSEGETVCFISGVKGTLYFDESNNVTNESGDTIGVWNREDATIKDLYGNLKYGGIYENRLHCEQRGSNEGDNSDPDGNGSNDGTNSGSNNNGGSSYNGGSNNNGGSSYNGGSNNNTNNNNNNTNSNSSQQPQSSTSTQTQTSTSQQSGGCPTISYTGGASGSGFATRYWDGCKPHCSWPEHANGNYSRQCTNKGKTEDKNYAGNKSICDGQGTAMTCTSQIPFTISGCDNIGFAFAAVPASNGGSCGKCFELSFTGEGKYETKSSHRALKNKKLIVMVTNVGTDVENGQFDVMIPGGGPGIYNATQAYGWGDQGKQYGGLLSNCEEQIGYSGDDSQIVKKRKECLIEKCNKSFSSDSEAKQGCLFLANFMEAAGNPKHTYKEVKCPDVLKNKY